MELDEETESTLRELGLALGITGAVISATLHAAFLSQAPGVEYGYLTTVLVGGVGWDGLAILSVCCLWGVYRGFERTAETYPQASTTFMLGVGSLVALSAMYTAAGVDRVRWMASVPDHATVVIGSGSYSGPNLSAVYVLALGGIAGVLVLLHARGSGYE